MKLNHLNLVVPDVQTAVAFFEKFFGFRCTEIKGDHVVAILKGADDFTLVLMPAKGGAVAYPQAFHIGFMLDDMQAVIDTYEQLKAGGVEVGEAPRKIRDSFGFYFPFGNCMIEVGHYL